MDEYQLEIRELRQKLARLQEADGDAALIEEYQAEVRNLSALYRAAQETLRRGDEDFRIREALGELGFGDWSLETVYGFVYDVAMELPLQTGDDLATLVDETDFAGSLLDSFHSGED